MKSKKHLTGPRWRAASFPLLNGNVSISDEWAAPEVVLEIVSFVQNIARHDHDLFRRHQIQRLGFVRNEALIRSLMLSTNLPVSTILHYYSRHRLPPYFEVFAKHVASLPSLSHAHPSDINKWVGALRAEVREPGLAKRADNYRRGADKLIASSKNYLRKVRNKYSNLISVRLEIGYSEAYLASQPKRNVSPKMAKSDLRSLLDILDRRTDFAGYAWKFDHRPAKSFYFHFALLFDGSDQSDDVELGELVGDLWIKRATRERGAFFNCNAKKETYKKQGMHGLGTIKAADPNAWKKLEEDFLHLARIDHFLKLSGESIGKTFSKGQQHLSVRRSPKKGTNFL